MEVVLNKKTADSIEKRLGVRITEISKMNVSTIDSLIEKKINKKLKYQTDQYPFIIPRGSVYLFLNRLLDIFYINRILSRI